MSTIDFVKSSFADPGVGNRLGQGNVHKFFAEQLTEGDDTSVITFTAEPLSISAQAKGTFSGGATIRLLGSWDEGTTWTALQDIFGATIAIGDDQAVFVAGAPPLLKADVANGSSADIDLTIAVRVLNEWQ